MTTPNINLSSIYPCRNYPEPDCTIRSRSCSTIAAAFSFGRPRTPILSVGLFVRLRRLAEHITAELSRGELVQLECWPSRRSPRVFRTLKIMQNQARNKNQARSCSNCWPTTSSQRTQITPDSPVSLTSLQLPQRPI